MNGANGRRACSFINDVADDERLAVDLGQDRVGRSRFGISAFLSSILASPDAERRRLAGGRQALDRPLLDRGKGLDFALALADDAHGDDWTRPAESPRRTLRHSSGLSL